MKKNEHFRKSGEDYNCLGNQELLSKHKIGFFCSVRCPGIIISKALDIIKDITALDIVLTSGFRSPVENKALEIFIRNCRPVIYCPGRSLKGIKLSPDLSEAMRVGYLALVSPFEEKINRISTKSAVEANHFIASISDSILVAYAEMGGKTEQLCQELLKMGKEIFVVSNYKNERLIENGAIPVDIGKYPKIWCAR